MKLTGQWPKGFAQISLAPFFTEGHIKTFIIPIQTFFMEKDLVTLENEQCDDEFDKLFQEFLESDDASDGEASDEDLTDDYDDNDADDTPIDWEQLVLSRKEQLEQRLVEQEGYPPYALSVCVLEDFDKSHFTDGPVSVHITADDETLPKTDRFRCDIFTADYFPMCSSRGNCEVQRSDNELTYQIACPRLWLPGKYLLYVRDNNQMLVKLGFQLDENLKTTYGELQYCDMCGKEDIILDAVVTDSNYWQLAMKPGMRQFRQKIFDCRHLDIYNTARKEMDGLTIGSNRNLLICTHNKDLTVLDLRDFKAQVAVENGFEHVDCSLLYDPACNNPYEHLNELFLTLSNQVLCLTNLGALLGTGGKVVVKRLLEQVRRFDGKVLLWLCGSRQEIEAIFDQFPSARAFFCKDSWIEQEPYTAFELAQTFFTEIVKEHMNPCMDIKDAIARTILKGYAEGALANWALSDIRKVILDDIRPRYTHRILCESDLEDLPLLYSEDVDLSRFTAGSETFDDCMRELDRMVGLDSVKQSILTMANSTRFFLERRHRGLPTSGNIAYHAIFTGNPGTGKTTVAKMLGRMYHSLGLLSKGEVMVVDRTRLVGRFIGETEENMKTVLEEARGNVLFIDEAYNLYDGSGDRKDFGARVIDSLLTVLSQPDPDMLVIFAGYEKEMDAMLNTNPGLMGRFPYKYKFLDYDANQLMEIACRLLRRDAYILSAEAMTLLQESITQTYNNRTKNFGNARWVEQFVNNGILPAMANRLIATHSDDYQHIEASDIRKAYEKFNPKATELKPRRKVGFSA